MHTFRYNVLSLHLYVSFGLMAVSVGDRTKIVTIPTPYNSVWLQDWNNRLEGVSTLVLVPAPTHLIYTPLIKPKWALALQTYQLESLAEFSLSGITFSFCIGYNHPGRPLRNPQKGEVVNHWVAGPYDKKSCPNAHISRFGLSPNVISRINGNWLLICHILNTIVLIMVSQNTYVA